MSTRLAVQPRAPVRIDWGHPLARDLRFFVTFHAGSPVDWVSGALGTPGGAPTIEGMANVRAAKIDSGTGDYYGWGDDDRHDIVASMTLAWRGVIGSIGNYRTFVSKTTGAGGTSSPFDFRTDLGPLYPVLVRSNAGLRIWTGNVAVPTGSVSTCEVTQADGIDATPAMYVNGAPITASSAGAGTGAADGTATGMRVGQRADAAVQMDGWTEYAIGWARVLTAAELDEFRRAPYRLFAPRDRRLWVVPASSNLTLSVTPGTLTLSGQSAALNRALAVSAGTLSLSGQAAALQAGLAVTAGSLTLSGASVGLTLGGNLALAVDAGSLSLAGASVGLTLGGNLALSVTPGALTLTGASVGVALDTDALPSRISFAFARRQARGTFARRSCTGTHARRRATFALG